MPQDPGKRSNDPTRDWLKLAHVCPGVSRGDVGQKWPGKKSVLIPIPKKGNDKKWSNNYTIALISHTSKLMLKILHARVQNSTWTLNLQMFQLDIEKAEEPEMKLPTSVGSLKKQESSRKESTSALLTMPKSWLCGSEQTVGNSERDGSTSPPHLSSDKSVCRSRSNS